MGKSLRKDLFKFILSNIKVDKTEYLCNLSCFNKKFEDTFKTLRIISKIDSVIINIKLKQIVKNTLNHYQRNRKLKLGLLDRLPDPYRKAKGGFRNRTIPEITV